MIVYVKSLESVILLLYLEEKKKTNENEPIIKHRGGNNKQKRLYDSTEKYRETRIINKALS